MTSIPHRPRTRRWPGIGRLALCVALAIVPALAPAHDVWIEASDFTPQPGHTVALQLKVGEHLSGEPLQLLPGLVKRFVLHDGSRVQAIQGRLGDDIAGRVRASSAGLQVVAYHSHPSRIELPAAKFNPYLAEEGLDDVLAQRAQAQLSNSPARELYARCAKALLQVGPVLPGQGDRAMGLPLELVAERNPYAVAAGDTLPVRITHLGRPLVGALVVAMNGRDPALKQALRSDADGRVHITLSEQGLWLVKAVHMVAAPPGWEADWSSLWASLTWDRTGLARP